MHNLSLLLKTHRLQLNLTQRELSEKAGVAYSTLRKLESTGFGSLSDFVKMLQALQMHDHLAMLGMGDMTFNETLPPPRRRARRRLSTSRGVEPSDKLSAKQLTPRQSNPTLTVGLKSERLGLSFPYDWSNPQIEDDVLIAKVLDRARFVDVSRTIAHFGLPQVEQVAERFGIAMGGGPLGAILPAIRIAQLAHAKLAT
jgi:transcriptional regulator with XRE-family HTH domain